MRTAVQIERHLRARHVGERIIERIVRLNPNGAPEGTFLRGAKPISRYRWGAYVSRGKFIRKHGRRAWEAMPHGLKHKDGKREYITWEDFLDNIHVLYDGSHPPRPGMIYAHYPTKFYANDPRCVVEFRRVLADGSTQVVETRSGINDRLRVL